MKARPILMSGPMVRALLDGRKTQTRRVISPENIRFWTGGLDYAGRHIKPDKDLFGHAMREAADFRFHDGVLAWTGAAFDYQAPATRTNWIGRCVFGQPGDLLWVREAILQDVYSELMPWGEYESYRGSKVEYVADGAKERHLSPSGPWMGKRPSIHMPRRASRLTLELTGVRAERLQDISHEDGYAEGSPAPDGAYSYKDSYMLLWRSINKKPGVRWEDNPWVWVLEFKVHRCNVDQFIKGKEAA